MGPSFTIAAGPRQRSHFRVRVPRYSWPYFTVSDSRLPQSGGPGPRMYIPPRIGWPSYTPRNWVPFRRLLQLAGLRWRYSNPPPHGVNLIRWVEWYSLEADPTENADPLLMWVAWYHGFHCSGTVQLVRDLEATPLPASLLLLRDVTADVTCSSVACAITITLISCLLCSNLVTAVYTPEYIWVSSDILRVKLFFGAARILSDKCSVTWMRTV
jgi:hypothetical protein